jgi:hypothetical protein
VTDIRGRRCAGEVGKDAVCRVAVARDVDELDAQLAAGCDAAPPPRTPL